MYQANLLKPLSVLILVSYLPHIYCFLVTPERLHSLEESQMTIPNTVLIDKKVQHNDSEISFADQSTIPANVMQDTNLLTAKPILDCKSLSRERLFELKGTESEETLELRSHLLGLIVSKADSSTVAESPTTVFETIGSPAGFSEEHLPLTPTESTMRVDSTPSSEYLMIPSQEKPELSTTNALLPKLERSPTFDWSHNSVVSDALTVGKTHLKLFKFEPVHNSREHLDLPILQHTEFLNPLPSSLDEPNVSKINQTTTCEMQNQVVLTTYHQTSPRVLRSTVKNTKESSTSFSVSDHQVLVPHRDCSLPITPPTVDSHSSEITVPPSASDPTPSSSSSAIGRDGYDLTTPTEPGGSSGARQPLPDPLLNRAPLNTTKMNFLIDSPSLESIDSEKVLSDVSSPGLMDSKGSYTNQRSLRRSKTEANVSFGSHSPPTRRSTNQTRNTSKSLDETCKFEIYLTSLVPGDHSKQTAVPTLVHSTFPSVNRTKTLLDPSLCSELIPGKSKSISASIITLSSNTQNKQ